MKKVIIATGEVDYDLIRKFAIKQHTPYLDKSIRSSSTPIKDDTFNKMMYNIFTTISITRGNIVLALPDDYKTIMSICEKANAIKYQVYIVCTKNCSIVKQHKFTKLIIEDSKDYSTLYNFMAKGEEPKVEESAMGVLICNGEILTTWENIYGNTAVSIPKGHIENGETHIEAAIREVFEETGVVLQYTNFCKELRPFAVRFFNEKEEEIIKIIYPLIFKSDTKLQYEIKEERIIKIDYLTYEDFMNICSYDNVRKIIMQVFER